MEKPMEGCLRGIAVLNNCHTTPIVLAEDGRTYGWHLSKPVETSKGWPKIFSTNGGIGVRGARRIDSIPLSSEQEGLHSGDVVRVGRNIGVVVSIQFGGTQQFSIKLGNLITATPGLARQVLRAALAGASGTPALILGPTGTGKECVARIIHSSRSRTVSRAPFVALNLGGLSEELCASELFGHVRGAFTGAERSKKGAFRTAGKGLVFLDELGEAPPGVQASLLRVLDDGEVRPVGQIETFVSEAQVIAATNREPDIDGAIHGIRFDLVQRLAGFVIRLPALKDRRDDIIPLAHQFLQQKFVREGRAFSLTSGAKALLQNHRWPGNVRELRTMLHRASLLSLGNVIDECLLEDSMNVWSQTETQVLQGELSHLDREVLRIAQLPPNRRGLARSRSGIPKTTFYRRLRQLGDQQKKNEGFYRKTGSTS